MPVLVPAMVLTSLLACILDAVLDATEDRVLEVEEGGGTTAAELAGMATVPLMVDPASAAAAAMGLSALMHTPLCFFQSLA